MSQPYYKKCIYCPKDAPRKLISEFYRSYYEGKHLPYCMDCHRAKMRARYYANRETILANSKAARDRLKENGNGTNAAY